MFARKFTVVTPIFNGTCSLSITPQKSIITVNKVAHLKKKRWYGCCLNLITDLKSSLQM